MSVDQRDARAYFKKREEEEANKKAEEKRQPLMQQVEIAKETGDPRLDKMLRHFAAKIQELNDLSIRAAMDGMRQATDEGIRTKQCEYMAIQGAIKILMELAAVPAQIIAEETPVSNIIH